MWNLAEAKLKLKYPGLKWSMFIYELAVFVCLIDLNGNTACLTAQIDILI